MRLKRLLSLTLAIGLTAVLCLGSVSVSAATVFPDMPKGANNLFDPDSLESLGTNQMAAVYENNTLMLQPRVGTDPAWASLTAAFDLPDEAADAANGFVIQFHTRISRGTADGSDALYVRVADAGSNDMFGSYYDIVLTRTKASLYFGRGERVKTSLPSTGQALSAPDDNIHTGDWKEVSIYLRKNGNGHAATVFIDREATVTADGSDTISLDPMDLCLMFGFQGYSAPLRGLRVYAVDPSASAFESAFNPNAEFENLEDGTEGKDGGDGGVTLIGGEEPEDTDKDEKPEDTDKDEKPADKEEKPAGKDDPVDNGKKDNGGNDTLMFILLGVGVAVAAAVTVTVILILKNRKKTDADENT